MFLAVGLLFFIIRISRHFVTSKYDFFLLLDAEMRKRFQMTGSFLLEKLCREDFLLMIATFWFLRNRNVFLSFASHFAVVAQLVEHWLPKPRVTGSSPAYRSVVRRE